MPNQELITAYQRARQDLNVAKETLQKIRGGLWVIGPCILAGIATYLLHSFPAIQAFAIGMIVGMSNVFYIEIGRRTERKMRIRENEEMIKKDEEDTNA